MILVLTNPPRRRDPYGKLSVSTPNFVNPYEAGFSDAQSFSAMGPGNGAISGVWRLTQVFVWVAAQSNRLHPGRSIAQAAWAQGSQLQCRGQP